MLNSPAVLALSPSSADLSGSRSPVTACVPALSCAREGVRAIACRHKQRSASCSPVDGQHNGNMQKRFSAYSLTLPPSLTRSPLLSLPLITAALASRPMPRHLRGSTDEKQLDSEIRELREQLKRRTDDLNRREGKKGSPAPVKPLSQTERAALAQLLPTTTGVEFTS